MKKIISFICLGLMLSFVSPLFAKDTVVDWNGSLEDEPKVPTWLQQMKRGNGQAYCTAYGLNNKLNRKWLVPTGATSLIGWEDGLIAARADTMASLGESIATDIIASTQSSQDNGAKSNIRKIVLESVNSVAGLEFEGYHWYEVETEVQIGTNKKGKPVMQKRHVWHVYAFYSMDYKLYNQQMLTALYKINLASGLSPDEAKKITATSWADVVKLQNNQEAHDRAVKEEQDRQLLNHNLSLENRQMTMEEKGQDYQYNLDNRNIDTQQLQIKETTKQVEIRSKAETQQAQSSNNAATTQTVSGPAPVQSNSNNSFDAEDVINDAMAFLLTL